MLSRIPLGWLGEPTDLAGSVTSCARGPETWG
jgi:hypothetical protein